MKSVTSLCHFYTGVCFYCNHKGRLIYPKKPVERMWAKHMSVAPVNVRHICSESLRGLRSTVWDHCPRGEEMTCWSTLPAAQLTSTRTEWHSFHVLENFQMELSRMKLRSLYHVLELEENLEIFWHKSSILRWKPLKSTKAVCSPP